MKKKISIYSSFDAQQADEAAFAANQSPLERLAQTVQLIKAVYHYPPPLSTNKRITIVYYKDR